MGTPSRSWRVVAGFLGHLAACAFFGILVLLKTARNDLYERLLVFPVVLSEDEVEEGIRNGTIIDSKTLSAWACYRLMK